MKAVSQLAILEAIEERTGNKACEIFDVIGGTSAGALNAAMLSLGYSSGDLLKLFFDKKNTIFSHRLFFWKSVFKTSRLKKIILKHLPHPNIRFKDTRCTLVLVSQNINDQIYYTFGTKSTPELKLSEGLLRSTAIIPFFEPYDGVWVDGGMGCFNNPSEIIVRKLVSHGYDPKKLRVLYLDSGFIPQRYSLINVKTRSTVKYITWMIDNIAHDSDKRSHSLFRFFFPEIEYHPLVFTYNEQYSMFSRKGLDRMYREAQVFAKKNIGYIMDKVLG